MQPYYNLLHSILCVCVSSSDRKALENSAIGVDATGQLAVFPHEESELLVESEEEVEEMESEITTKLETDGVVPISECWD